MDWMPLVRVRIVPRGRQSFCHTRPMALKEHVYDLNWKLYQKLQKYVYPYFSRRSGAEDALFFNVGYEEDPPMALPLEASDEAYRPCIQLYHRTATQADLSGKRVLEVGCGHGGGASYLMRTLHPASYTGLDLNPAGIAFCQKRHNLAGLDFVQGNAENLPFADQSFDAVINIESSVFYPRFSRFLAEVARVLRPGGHFLYADFRLPYKVATWEAELANAPMRMLSQSEINAEVKRGLEKNPLQRLGPYARINASAARFMASHPRINAFAARFTTSDQPQHFYRMYCFAKD
jgi:fatty-acid O-methyltransferase